MATYRTIPGTDVAFTADADLTGLQYHFVKASSTAGNVQIATGAFGPTPIGVLQNSPSAGQEATVRMLGPTKLYCVTDSSCAIAYGRYLTCNASGQGTGMPSIGGSPALAVNIGTAQAVSASQFIEAFFFGPLSNCPISAS